MTIFLYKTLRSDLYQTEVDMKRCRASVSSDGRAPTFHQCYRKGSVEREFKGEQVLFCRQHDPEAVAAREAARNKKREAARNKKREAAQHQQYAQYDKEYLAAAIADGIGDIVADKPLSSLNHVLPRKLLNKIRKYNKLRGVKP